jgi:hypothetical protein
MVKGIGIFQLSWVGGALLLSGRSLVTPTSARALSVSSLTQLRQVVRPASTTATTSTASSFLTSRGGARFSTNNGDDEEEQEQETILEKGAPATPATGWTHTTPKSSKFWQSANGEDGVASAADDDSAEEDSSSKLRTGWLHNSKSKTAVADPKEGGGSSNKAQLRLQQAMKQQERNHRIPSPPAFHACGSDRQIVVTEHRLSIPLFRPVGGGNNNNNSRNKSPRIDLAFTIVEEVKDGTTQKWFDSLGSMSPQQRATAYIEQAALSNADEMMIYLQGGPGFGSPAPVVGLAFSQDSSWGAKALGNYKRVVLMDQRGTGKSTPITKQSLEKRFPDLFVLDHVKEGVDLDSLATSHPEEHQKFEETLKEATNYMAQFRADSIVQDAEDLKEALMIAGEPGSVSLQ